MLSLNCDCPQGAAGRASLRKMAVVSPCCHRGYAYAGDLPMPPTLLEKRGWVDIQDHARYRFLLHLDGHSSSSRLQFLLATNSAVLKQQSYFWEYYCAL